MKLRTQILLFLFLFALAPLMAAVLINLPLVLDRLELFYQQAYLQNLRADFRDLDQHLSSRDEMVRLLSKLPEPGSVLGMGADLDDEAIDLSRARYTEWLNQVLGDQLDIVQILFLDDGGRERFWLERDLQDFQWLPTTRRPRPPPERQIEAALALDRPRGEAQRQRSGLAGRLGHHGRGLGGEHREDGHVTRPGHGPSR